MWLWRNDSFCELYPWAQRESHKYKCLQTHSWTQTHVHPPPVLLTSYLCHLLCRVSLTVGYMNVFFLSYEMHVDIIGGLDRPWPHFLCRDKAVWSYFTMVTCEVNASGCTDRHWTAAHSLYIHEKSSTCACLLLGKSPSWRHSHVLHTVYVKWHYVKC